MHSTTLALPLLSATAYLLFATAGALLWKGTRSFAPALIALGFAIVLIDQVILAIRYSGLINNFSGQPGDTLFVIYHRANSPWMVLLGMWLAALGLLCHAAVVLRRR